MATDEVVPVMVGFKEAAAVKRVEFWASTMDAFLQDFLEKAKAGDRLGAIVATARLAQLGAYLADEYEANCNAMVLSETEEKVANQAAALTVRMVSANGAECEALAGNTKASPGPAPDRSLS